MSDSTYFHRVYKDPLIGGLMVGQIGSKKHILGDDEEPVTKGYHEFYMHKGTLMGQLGATEEMVTHL